MGTSELKGIVSGAAIGRRALFAAAMTAAGLGITDLAVRRAATKVTTEIDIGKMYRIRSALSTPETHSFWMSTAALWKAEEIFICTIRPMPASIMARRCSTSRSFPMEAIRSALSAGRPPRKIASTASIIPSMLQGAPFPPELISSCLNTTEPPHSGLSFAKTETAPSHSFHAEIPRMSLT